MASETEAYESWLVQDRSMREVRYVLKDALEKVRSVHSIPSRPQPASRRMQVASRYVYLRCEGMKDILTFMAAFVTEPDRVRHFARVQRDGLELFGWLRIMKAKVLI